MKNIRWERQMTIISCLSIFLGLQIKTKTRGKELQIFALARALGPGELSSHLHFGSCRLCSSIHLSALAQSVRINFCRLTLSFFLGTQACSQLVSSTFKFQIRSDIVYIYLKWVGEIIEAFLSTKIWQKYAKILPKCFCSVNPCVI